jgi:predicted GIY-YIG superfamily endonuclease
VLVLARRCREKGKALRLEHAIKQLTRAEKQRLDAKRVAAIARSLR